MGGSWEVPGSGRPLGVSPETPRNSLQNRTYKKRCLGAQVVGNVAKMTPKGTQNGTNIGLRGQLFGFWANCVFVQHYSGLAIFSRSGRSRNHPKTTPKSALEKNRRKSDRNTGKIPKSTPKVVPWGSPLEPKGDEKSSKIDAGPPLDPLWTPFWPPGVSGGLRVGARTPK